MEKTVKVLIAEDPVRELLLRVVGKKFKNAEVHAASNFDDAKRLLEEHHQKGEAFHLLITDTEMPGQGGGLELLEHARKLRKEVSVIGMSGKPEYEKKYTSQGADFVEKPFMLPEVVEKIRKHGEPHGLEMR